MDVRDAVEDDAEAMADITGLPTAATRELLHDRSVRIADRDGDVTGVVAFDAVRDAVHVTCLAGDDDAMARLLEEPRRFGEREGMAVELVVPSDDDAAEVATAAGFEDVGRGPRFDGAQTRRFRLESN